MPRAQPSTPSFRGFATSCHIAAAAPAPGVGGRVLGAMRRATGALGARRRASSRAGAPLSVPPRLPLPDTFRF